MIANIEYIQPIKADKERFLGRLKYLQYRDNRDGHIPQETGVERWIDCGMGDNFRSIAVNANAFASRRVEAWTLVLSPNPELLKEVPREEHQRLVHDITVRFMEEFFAERGYLVPPEFSFVVHHKDTVNGDAQPHSHVVIAGSSMSGFERVPFEIGIA